MTEQEWYVQNGPRYGYGLCVRTRNPARAYRPIVAKNELARTEDGYVAVRLHDEKEARIIAAAPSLLSAAKAALGLGVIPVTQPEYEMLVAAIALAEGGSL